MALKVELKPGERFILGDSVVTNGRSRASLLIEGSTPILREKSILRPEEADTPAKQVYLVIQLMYLGDSPAELHPDYFRLITELMQAAPSLIPAIDRINNLMLTGSYYKALREAETLVALEKDILENAAGNKKLQRRRAGNDRTPGA